VLDFGQGDGQLAVLADAGEKQAIEVVLARGLSSGPGVVAGLGGVHGLGGLAASPPRASVVEALAAEADGQQDGQAQQHPAPGAGEEVGEEHISTASY